MPTRREWCFFAAGAAALGCLLCAVPALRAPRSHLTTTGRPKGQGERAFVLNVNLAFREPADAEQLLAAWSEAAAWCVRHEPFLYAYEVAQSDKDPLNYVITERYRSKKDYLGAHKRSSAFLAFRPKMRALQDGGRVSVTGSSYQELGIGFT